MRSVPALRSPVCAWEGVRACVRARALCVQRGSTRVLLRVCGCTRAQVDRCAYSRTVEQFGGTGFQAAGEPYVTQFGGPCAEQLVDRRLSSRRTL